MKIGFFITARLKSSRLKRKILLPLNDKPILQHVIDRCIATKGVDGVVLCTSTNDQDSELIQYAEKNNIEYFRGSEDDVLERLLKAAEKYNYDGFLSITADNPLFSIYTSQLAIEWFKNNNFDFIFTKGLPVGLSTYFLKTKALKVAHYMKGCDDTEIWGPFVNRPDFFNIGEQLVNLQGFDESLRITCDYKEDYLLLKTIYENVSTSGFIDVGDIYSYYNTTPDLRNVNGQHMQRAVSQSELAKISNTFDRRIGSGKTFAESIGLPIKPAFHRNQILVIGN